MISLTKEQEKLAQLGEGAFLIVAPPGSGKTEVIAQRIVRLVHSTSNESFKILALSFTKNAASSMRTRVSERLGEHTWRVVCTTYHAFCLDILLHYGHLVGLPAEPTVYDSLEDRLQALAQGLVAEGLLSDSDAIDRNAAAKALDAIGRLERDLVPPDAAPTTSLPGLPVSLREGYRAYRLALKLNGALDFDSILSRAYDLLCTRPEIAHLYRSTYRYIMIDEAQDTSTVQYELLKALCGTDHRNVFMVADPAQSIYAFRGSSSKFVRLFVQQFGAQRYELGVTFRCAEEILRVAQLVLPQAKSAFHTSSSPAPSAKGSVQYSAFPSEPAEAAGVMDWVQTLTRKGMASSLLATGEERAISPEDIAILARSRNHLRHLTDLLDARGIAYHFSAGESGIFDSDEYRILLYALKLLASPHDVAIARGLISCIESSSLPFSLAPGVGDSLDASVLLPLIAQSASGTSLQSAMSTLAEASTGTLSLSTALEQLSDWDPSDGILDPNRLELVVGDRALLKDRWVAYRNLAEADGRTWQGMVLQLANAPRPESPGIRVLTVHAAKGLEFRAVVVVGLNEGSFPDFRNTDQEAIESERRLMYVAITRASRLLFLSRPHQRQTRFGPRIQESSRFLSDMGFQG